MKTYKIATDPNTTIILSEIDIRNLIKNNPELLTPTPTHKRKYFVPKVGEEYYYLDNVGKIKSIENDEENWDIYYIKSGNCFATEQDAQDELNRRQSLVRIWNNYDDKYSWDIDWEDMKQPKHYIEFDYINSDFLKEAYLYTYVHKASTELPYFKSAEDRNQFVEENEKDLLTVFNIKK